MQGIESWRPGLEFRCEYDEDRFIIDYFKGKTGGYCIDIGAADGVTASNTFRLINEYDWRALLIEPCPRHSVMLDRLFGDLPDVYLSKVAVHQTEDVVTFYEVVWDDIGMSNLLGTGNISDSYSVPAKSIGAILEEAKAPDTIDFVSLDIELSEPEVLNHWDFNRYKVDLWCVENGRDFADLFAAHGYDLVDGYSACNVFFKKQ